MLLRELLEKLETIKVCADLDMHILGVSYDTRVIRTGEIFVAIRGYKHDGHKYIEEAVEKGVVCVICEEEPEISVPYILVKDSRIALSIVSAVWFKYPAKKVKIIGVTGTNGKTSVTYLIKHVLEKCSSKKVGLIGTNGNFIGDRELPSELTTPESFEVQKLLDKMVLENCEYVVMEASSHALHLHRVFGIEFDIGVFTNLTPEHLDFHETMEEYALAKSLLFKSCKNAIINIDDPFANTMLENCTGNVSTFAVNNNSAKFVGKDVKLFTDKTEFCVITVGEINRVEVNIPGLFTVYNALAAIAAVSIFEFEIENIITALKSSQGVKGRAEILYTGQDFTVLIDYAHTPDALRSIIKAAREFTRGKVITLFGCGGDRDKSKRSLMGEIAALLSDFVYITTDNPRTEEPADIIADILSGINESYTSYKSILSRHEAINTALAGLKSGDVLIIAGKGHETYQIIGEDKIDFDDREVVAEYFKNQRIQERKVSEEGLELSGKAWSLV
ncbi:MAG: UDP-N-acetylmuramoyl-L-alanyl-D-glutamate--2,6-diaminopimelate ligase [Oscillospiraceae bacterium]|jgi:UDP-N-acetylmuramoyl-L-alanyl-D-glutamate--2,6-diaminopimelate ligase|nr:UDP-N-acetylmuramoyl-L-alanyl-D-glutamate--2,6-diaminopimelate ligase [Oscillospiraceae bacterium]